MSSVRKLLQTLMVCGMIPLIVGSGLPQSACGCGADESACACAAAETGDCPSATCGRSCCQSRAKKAARVENPPPSAGLSAAPVAMCRCALVPVSPVDRQSEPRMEPVAQAVLMAMPSALVDAAPPSRPDLRPSLGELPPLDRCIAFCVLLV